MERPRRNPDSLVNKAGTLIKIGILGATAPNPPAELDEIFKESYETAQNPYQSPRAHANPTLDVLEDELLHEAQTFGNADLTRLPWLDSRFSKGHHLAFVIAYTDLHKQQVPRAYYEPDLSRKFVDQVMTSADAKQRQITLPEQFRIGLEIADHSILGAAVIAHAGSRSIARGSDTILDPKFRYSADQIMHWRDCVGHFDGLSGRYSDPTADTYHFWSTFTPGLLSEVKLTSKDVILEPVYRQVYTHMSPAVRTFRYKLSGRTGETHPEADLLGFHIGSMVGASLRAKNTTPRLENVNS